MFSAEGNLCFYMKQYDETPSNCCCTVVWSWCLLSNINVILMQTNQGSRDRLPLSSSFFFFYKEIIHVLLAKIPHELFNLKYHCGCVMSFSQLHSRCFLVTSLVLSAHMTLHYSSSDTFNIFNVFILLTE